MANDFTSPAPFSDYGVANDNATGQPAFASIGRGNQTPVQFAEGMLDGSGGYNNPGGIWLPIFEAQVQANYDQFRIFEPLINSATIETGKAKAFPMTGQVGFKPVWGAGDELFGGITDSSGVFMITLDERPMAAHFELDSIDLLVTQWEFRDTYAKQCAERLANTRDGQILATIVRGAAMTKHTNDPRELSGGWLMGHDDYNNLRYFGRTSYFTSANITTNAVSNAITKDQRMQGAQDFLNAVTDVLVAMREQNLPTEGMYAAVSPQGFEDLIELGVPTVSYVPPLVGAIAAGNTGAAQAGPQYASNGPIFGVSPLGAVNLNQRLVWKGVTIVQTNRIAEFANIKPGGVVNSITLPAAGNDVNITDPALINYATHVGNLFYGQANKYGLAMGQFKTCGAGAQLIANLSGLTHSALTGADVRAVMWHPSAVVGLRKIGLSGSTMKDVRRNTWFTCFHMYGGTDVMRPELCAAFVGTPLSTVAATKKTRMRELLGGANVGLA